MMVSTYFKNLIANHVWHTSASADLPSTYYLALSTTEPLEDGTGVTEPSAVSGYTRIKMTGLANAVGGVVKNGSVLSWPELTSDQGVASYWALFDAATGGHLLMGNSISAKHLDSGTEVRIKADKLVLSVLGA